MTIQQKTRMDHVCNSIPFDKECEHVSMLHIGHAKKPDVAHLDNYYMLERSIIVQNSFARRRKYSFLEALYITTPSLHSSIIPCIKGYKYTSLQGNLPWNHIDSR